MLQVDSDVNDPFTSAIRNNSFESAQFIPNPAIIKGYATAAPTGVTSDRFAEAADLLDIFSISAFATQSVLLEIADFESTNPASVDLDLALADTNGNFLEVSQSVANSFESILIPADGDYFLVVRAFNGASNYTLSLSTEFATTTFDSQISVENLRVDRLALKTQPTDIENLAFVASTGHTAEALVSGDTSPALVALDLSNPAARKFLANEQRSIAGTNNTKQTTLHSLQTLGAVTPRTSSATDPMSMLETMKLMNSREASDVFSPMYYPTNLQAATSISDPVPDRGIQWNLFTIGWFEAQNQLQNITLQKRPILAVIDSGFFVDHPELSGVLVDQRDFVPSNIDGDGLIADASEDVLPTDNPQCHVFHGTHVSTIAVAPQNNVGITGVAPGIGLMGIKVGFSSGPNCAQLAGDVPNAILYAAGLPNSSGTVPPVAADVINMSLGARAPDQRLTDAINQAVAQGVIVVAAAGNDGGPIPNFPAASDNVIAVAATDILSQRAPYSSFYTRIDIAAPGGDASADLNADGLPDGIAAGIAALDGFTFQPSYAFYQGTSMASPTVAAGIALMKGIEPSLTQSNIESMLAAGDLTTDIGATGFDVETGFGLMSLPRMIERARQFSDGGNTTVVSVVTTTPSLLEFGATLDQIALELVQLGNASVTVDSVTVSDTLMLADGTSPISIVSPDSLDGFGVYSFVLNRGAIDAGSLSGSLTFGLSDGTSQVVPVAAVNQVSQGIANSAAVFYIIQRLGSNETFETIEQQFSSINGVREGEATSPALAAGTYRIIFGTDTDNDFLICDEGELCGTFPFNNFGFDASFVLSEDISDASYILQNVGNLALTAFDGTFQPAIGSHRIAK